MNDTSYVIEPNNRLRLLMCPIELDNKNQITFSNENDQYEYFDSLPSLEVDKITYQRHDNVIRFPANADDVLSYNYVMYQNTNYGNKWFYAFIERIEYSNSNMCNIYIKTDTFQTYQFDINYMDSFIEREHVNNDSIGLHTVPENLELGEYISNGNATIIDDFQIWGYIVNVTSKPDGSKLSPTILGGIAMAGGLYGFHGSNDIVDFINFINSYDQRADAIVNVYIVPYKLIEGEYNEEHFINSINVKEFNKTITKPTTIDNYTPKNKKLLTFPYQYLILSNNNGSSNIIHYEKFTGANASFEIIGLPTTGGSIKCVPTNYLGAMQEEGLVAGKYPTCSWSNDMFINWLTQNGVNIGVGIASSGLTLAKGIGVVTAGGSVTGVNDIINGTLGIAQTLGQIYQHSFTPPSANGNINCGDVITSSGLNTFIFYPMSIKQEYAKIIDNYFSMFGYKVNEVKKPNITGRLNWNFVKTIGLNIIGDIPQFALEEIKTIFNNGVTLWHNPNTFLDYSQNNNII